MPLQEIYYVAEMIVGLAVITSIVFVAVELRQNTYLMRATMADQRKQNVNWFLSNLLQIRNLEIFTVALMLSGMSSTRTTATELFFSALGRFGQPWMSLWPISMAKYHPRNTVVWNGRCGSMRLGPTTKRPMN